MGEGHELTSSTSAETSSAEIEPISYQLAPMESKLPDRAMGEFISYAILAAVACAAVCAHHYAGTSGIFAFAALFLGLHTLYSEKHEEDEVEVYESVRNLLPNDTARIWVTGHPIDIHKLAPLRNVSFEPEVFSREYAGSSVFVVGLLGCLVGCGVHEVFSRWISAMDVFPLFGNIAPFFGIPVLWGVSRLFPTYYRIVPGRLDVMRFSPLTNSARILDRLDLKEARIRVRFDKTAVEILSHGRSKKIQLRGVSEPFKFVDALLLGAVTTYAPGPVPDDRLIG